jgi:hypothetical protein
MVANSRRACSAITMASGARSAVEDSASSVRDSVFPGWVEVDKGEPWIAPGEIAQGERDAALLYLKAFSNTEPGQIGAQRGDGGCGALDKGDMRCAAAQRLDADCAGAGVEIGEARAFNVRREDIEEGFAQAVAGRARCHAAWRGERTSAIGAGDDTHEARKTQTESKFRRQGHGGTLEYNVGTPAP